MKFGYRVNRDKLILGDKILSSSYFFDNIDEQKKKIENIFESKKPQLKPSRHEAIFVFENLQDAKSWMGLKNNLLLYKISIEDKDLLHTGDWNWLNEALKGNIESCAHNYWAGKLTENPVIEWIVKEGLIDSEITISQEERDEIRKRRYPGTLTPKELAHEYLKNTKETIQNKIKD